MLYVIIVLSILLILVNGRRCIWKRLSHTLRDTINEQIEHIQEQRKKQ